jgi:hypothetical protein
MSTDFRALCAELAEELVNEYGYCTEWEKGLPLCESNVSELLTRARAALAQPEPVAPTDEALANFSGWFCRNYPGPDTIIHKPEWHAPKVFRAAADAIARYGTPAIQPVPVSERLPGPEDCDEQGRCWVFDDQLGLPSWTLIKVQGESMDSDMHWLPANALPTPEAKP